VANLGPDEADTCRDYVLPALSASGWSAEMITEQHQVQAELRGRFQASGIHRKRRADYVLSLEADLPLMVVEAKRLWASPGDGIQQATRYAAKLDVPFALSTNGTGWVLHNRVTGIQSAVDFVPTPEEAWSLFIESHGLNDDARDYLRLPFSRDVRNADGSVRELRYYQRRAIHEILTALARGEQRVLAVMATGSGKTFTALQLVWKLSAFRRRQQQSDRALRNYRVLYLADRDILVKEPRGLFEDVFPNGPVTRVSTRDTRLSPDFYFATYQALDVRAGDVDADSAEQTQLMANYPPDFFDLIVVDECHRGSARADSAWRAILERFSSAAQLGLTATPVDRGDVRTFEYFGNPVFTYSLRDGIEDGFLAPYTVRRVVLNVDAEGVEVVEGQLDAQNRAIPEGTYGTADFERRLRLPDRTRAMARRIIDVIGETTDRAVVFCVDAAHALTMTEDLRNLRPERTRHDPEWVARIMHVERDKDRLIEEFTDPSRDVPQIAVTSSLLSTGVDIEDLKYVVLCRNIGSLTEFKQIIGRGTRLYPDKGKSEFEIMDFVGATRLFQDPAFDGPPLVAPTTEVIDTSGTVEDDPPDGDEDGPDTVVVEEPEPPFDAGGHGVIDPGPPPHEPTPRDVFTLSGIQVSVDHEGFYVHDTETGQPRLVGYVDWTRERILDRFDGPDDLLEQWSTSDGRRGVVDLLARGRIDPARLLLELGARQPHEIDTVDALINVAFNVPMRTRAERARRAITAHRAELDAMPETAREILSMLLDLYARDGVEESGLATVVNVPPLSDLGTPAEIAAAFGGARAWHAARDQLHSWVYSA
jgi:type I restriction enzyme, R subunit